MKTRLKLFALLLAAAAFAALPILAADSIDTMTRKVTGSTSAAGLTSKSIGAYALVSKDNTISSAATIGNSIELVAISATQWVAFASSGTWTDVN